MNAFDAAQYGNQVGGRQLGFDLDDRAHRVRAVEMADMVERRNALYLIARNTVDGNDGFTEQPFGILRGGIQRNNRLA